MSGRNGKSSETRRRTLGVLFGLLALIGQFLGPHLHRLEVVAEEHGGEASVLCHDARASQDAVSQGDGFARDHGQRSPARPHHDESACSICQGFLQLRQGWTTTPGLSVVAPLITHRTVLAVGDRLPIAPVLLAQTARGPPTV